MKNDTRKAVDVRILEKAREIAADLESITDELERRLIDLSINGGHGNQNWGDVGDFSDYANTVHQLADRVCRRGEYA